MFHACHSCCRPPHRRSHSSRHRRSSCSRRPSRRTRPCTSLRLGSRRTGACTPSHWWLNSRASGNSPSSYPLSVCRVSHIGPNSRSRSRNLPPHTSPHLRSPRTHPRTRHLESRNSRCRTTTLPCTGSTRFCTRRACRPTGSCHPPRNRPPTPGAASRGGTSSGTAASRTRRGCR